MKKFVILGAAGAIGQSVAAALASRGVPTRVVGRSEDKLRKAFGSLGAEIFPADLTTEAGCASALAGADVAAYTLGLNYSAKDFEAYGPMMQACVAAAKRVGLRKLLLVSNVYPYGRPTTPTVAEDHPRTPCSVKGTHRKTQEDVLLAAHDAGGLSTVSLRLPDFYGPNATLSLAHLVFESAVRGARADVLGPIDTPHEFVFVPDVGPVVLDLLGKDDGFGTAYNFAGPGTITVRELATKAYADAGAGAPKLRIAGKTMVRFLGLFSPVMRELVEMQYLQETPVLLDDRKLRAQLPTVKKTPYVEGIAKTVEGYRAAAKA